MPGSKGEAVRGSNANGRRASYNHFPNGARYILVSGVGDDLQRSRQASLVYELELIGLPEHRPHGWLLRGRALAQGHQALNGIRRKVFNMSESPCPPVHLRHVFHAFEMQECLFQVGAAR